MALRQDYFDKIDTAEKAYYLGLLYADGNTRRSKEERNHQTNISLQIRDGDVLRDMSRALYGEDRCRLLRPPNRDGKNRQDQLVFTICSVQMTPKLISYGIVPAKSLILRPPTVDLGPFIRDFIRGFFDGNGCVSTYIEKASYADRLRVDISFNSTRPMLEWIQGFLTEQGIVTRIVPHAKISRLKLSSYKAAVRFWEALYYPRAIGIKRKRDKMMEVVSYTGVK